MLFFDIVLIVGIMESQGYGVQNEYLKSLRNQFFLISTIFGRGLMILLCSFLLLEVVSTGEIIIAIICILIAIVDLVIGINEDTTAKFMVEVKGDLQSNIPDALDPKNRVYFDNPAPANEVITFQRPQANQPQVDNDVVNPGDIEL